MDQYSEHYADPSNDDAAQRQDSRDSLFLMADLRLEGSHLVRAVRVRNLSAGGLMAEYPEGLPQNQRLEIEVRGIGMIRGQVAWSAAGRIGIAFDQQIDPLLARKPVGRGPTTPHYAKATIPRIGRR